MEGHTSEGSTSSSRVSTSVVVARGIPAASSHTTSGATSYSSQAGKLVSSSSATAPKNTVSKRKADSSLERLQEEEETEQFSVQTEVSSVPSSCEEYYNAERMKKSKFHLLFYSMVEYQKKTVVIFTLAIAACFVVAFIVMGIITIYYAVQNTHLCFGETNSDLMVAGQETLLMKNFQAPDFVPQIINNEQKYVAQYDALKIIADSPDATEFSIEYTPEKKPECKYDGALSNILSGLKNTVCSCELDDNGRLISYTCYSVASKYTMVDGECTSIFIQLDTKFDPEEETDNEVVPTEENVTWQALCGTKSPCNSLIRYYTSIGYIPADSDSDAQKLLFGAHGKTNSGDDI